MVADPRLGGHRASSILGKTDLIAYVSQFETYWQISAGRQAGTISVKKGVQVPIRLLPASNPARFVSTRPRELATTGVKQL
jgi:hypothetical protein